jgi:hypothetical protein
MIKGENLLGRGSKRMAQGAREGKVLAGSKET